MSSSVTTHEPIHVVDTHALIWYLLGSRQLGSNARRIFLAAERGETRLYISSISIAEMYYANRKFQWFSDFSMVYQDIKSKPYFRFVPFTADDVLAFDEDEAVPEMHDRIIAGLARRLGAPIVTSDPQIAAAKLVSVVW